MIKILEIKDLHVSYGPIEAIKGINISVEKGQIVALLGANGAGKTSTLNTISGVVKAKSGEILLEGENIINLRPDKISKKGIMQSPEGRKILNGLSVEDNLKGGAYAVKDKEFVQKEMEYVYKMFPILGERRKQQASTLSGGEQQMLAIGRALMGKPKILVLDEPSLGLAPLVIKDIFKALVQIKSEGTTILIVEQNAKQTLKIADYAYVLELGKISGEGKGSDLLQDKSLIEAYLGG